MSIMSLVLSAGMQETVPLPAPLGLICRTYQAVTAKDKQGACTDGNVLSHLVWAMYGLCMSDAWAVSVAWYERKANKRERARSHTKSKCFCQLSSTSTVARTDGCRALVHHVVFDNLICNSFPLAVGNQSIQNLYELVASTFHSSDCYYSGLGFCPRHHTFA